MEKKEYIQPIVEAIILSAELMQDTPAFGPASMPADPSSSSAPRRDRPF